MPNQGRILYKGCAVDTTNGAMDFRKGLFNVRRSGIYMLTVTVRFSTINGASGESSVTLLLNNKVGNGHYYLGNF